MSNKDDYFASLHRAQYSSLLRLTMEQEAAILNAYVEAGDSLRRKFSNAKNNTATKAYLKEYMARIYKDTEKIVYEYGLQGAQVQLEYQQDILEAIMDFANLDYRGVNTSLSSMIGSMARENLNRIIKGGIYSDNKGLSSRIWSAAKHSGNCIQNVLNAGLAQNMGSVELSKLLKDYVNPDARKKWTRDKIRDKLGPGYSAWNNSLEYNALRLARTTISHMSTLATKQAKEVNPYAEKAKWHSVHAIGRTCDLCTERDGQIYTMKQLPFDHPNGLCYTTVYFDKSLDDMADELKDWAEGNDNTRLDNWWADAKTKGAPKPTALRDDSWFDKNMPVMRDRLSKYWSEARAVMSNSPKFMQDWLAKYDRHLKFISRTEQDAYYSTSKKAIAVNIRGEQINPRGPYGTFFHEYGHLLDDAVATADYSAYSRLSMDGRFIDALYKDYADSTSKYSDAEIVRLLRQKGDKSDGVQDIFSGMSLNRIRAGYGHATDYWTRRRDYYSDGMWMDPETGELKDAMVVEVASEAWANITSAFVRSDITPIMQEWYPESCKVYEQIVKETLDL